MHVQSILSVKGSSVATIGPELEVREAVAALESYGIGALVVSTDRRAIDGIISERDVVRRLASEGPSVLDRPVADVMTSEVHTCGMSTTVEQLMALMTAERIRHVPVVDGDGELVGIVSIGDVVKSRLGELEGENRALFDYITYGR